MFPPFAATALSAFCITYTTLVIYAAVFGATIGAYVGLTSVVLVDLLGLEKFTNAFGVVLLFQGIASLAGPPIAGNYFLSNLFKFDLITLCVNLTLYLEFLLAFRSFKRYHKFLRSCFLRGWFYDRHQWPNAVRHSFYKTMFWSSSCARQYQRSCTLEECSLNGADLSRRGTCVSEIM